MFTIGQRIKPMRLPDGSLRAGTIEALMVDDGDTLYRVRFDGVYYVNVSECVGGVNPAAQFRQWYMAEDLNAEGEPRYA